MENNVVALLSTIIGVSALVVAFMALRNGVSQQWAHNQEVTISQMQEDLRDCKKNERRLLEENLSLTRENLALYRQRENWQPGSIDRRGVG